jgi:hypothetical protein
MRYPEEFPKPVLSWDESEIYQSYRRRLVAHKPLWRRVGRSVIFFGVWFLPGYLLLSLLRIPVESYVATALPAALVLTLMDWMFFHFPVCGSRVGLYEEKIGIRRPKQFTSIGYGKIAGWRMIERKDQNCILHLLTIQGPKRVLTWAIPNVETRDQAAQILSEKVGPQSVELKPQWE